MLIYSHSDAFYIHFWYNFGLVKKRDAIRAPEGSREHLEESAIQDQEDTVRGDILLHIVDHLLDDEEVFDAHADDGVKGGCRY
jgi:hypothetical protein